MILKEYFVFEKNISNKLFDITSYEIKPSENPADIIPDDAFDSFCILFNVGSILPIKMNGHDFFCPAKDGLMSYRKRPEFIFNSKSYYKFILLRLNDSYSKDFMKRIHDASDYPFSEILSETGFCFSFSLNIAVIEMLENLFKMCGENENTKSSFFYLELEANFITMTAAILKIILFEEHKFNEITASPDLKFYMVMRKTIVGGQNLDDMLAKYKLSKDDFISSYRQYFPKGKF